MTTDWSTCPGCHTPVSIVHAVAIRSQPIAVRSSSINLSPDGRRMVDRTNRTHLPVRRRVPVWSNSLTRTGQNRFLPLLFSLLLYFFPSTVWRNHILSKSFLYRDKLSFAPRPYPQGGGKRKEINLIKKRKIRRTKRTILKKGKGDKQPGKTGDR